MLTGWPGSLIFVFPEGPEAEVAASGGVDMGTLGIFFVMALVIVVVYATKADIKAAEKTRKSEQELYEEEAKWNDRSQEAGDNDGG